MVGKINRNKMPLLAMFARAARHYDVLFSFFSKRGLTANGKWSNIFRNKANYRKEKYL